MWGILGSQALQATVGVLKERIAGFEPQARLGRLSRRS